MEPPLPTRLRRYRSGELATAERNLCAALEAARAFEARDTRFAETLDELGLLAFLRGDYAAAEAMQGAATAEILLAQGPPKGNGDDVRGASPSVALYLARLGAVFAKLERPDELARLQQAPHRILELGYVPASALVGRLDWLIGQYLLAEELAAADWLTELRGELRAVLDAP